MIEVTWAQILHQELRMAAMKRCAPPPPPKKVTTVGDVLVPEDVANLLNKGPKFSLEPDVKRQEWLSLNRQIARKAPEEKHEKCLLDGVDALMKAGGTATTRSGKDPLGKVVDYFQRNKLCLLLSDREGGFVVMEQGDYNTRATEAIRKNFEALRPSDTKVKCKTAALCRDLELSSGELALPGCIRCKKPPALHWRWERPSFGQGGSHPWRRTSSTPPSTGPQHSTRQSPKQHIGMTGHEGSLGLGESCVKTEPTISATTQPASWFVDGENYVKEAVMVLDNKTVVDPVRSTCSSPLGGEQWLVLRFGHNNSLSLVFTKNSTVYLHIVAVDYTVSSALFPHAAKLGRSHPAA
ncbi:hypothetical protein HPB50_022039 [Hyalomma asiaticum]|uniref:Uncharacterized protein n=1 Tax=Hyalomma asiaticum TaxID=266040 RepID=A0ACB7SZ38_HYAAI|nr:hypothetical protein HPB50_022039 [Hyalomma asiaticum]